VWAHSCGLVGLQRIRNKRKEKREMDLGLNKKEEKVGKDKCKWAWV